jgi:hypothetical protein
VTAAILASTTPEGTLDASQKLTIKRYEWLNKHFPQGSSSIEAMKKMINKSTAHANIAYTNQNFRLAETGDGFNTPFFDFEDEYFVMCDLLMASCIALSYQAFLWCEKRRKRDCVARRF